METSVQFLFVLLIQLVATDRAVRQVPHSVSGHCIYGCIPGMTRCSKVFLTVSSLPDQFLEMNWVTKCDPLDDVADTISLYKDDPYYAAPLVSINASEHDGYFKTTVKFELSKIPNSWHYLDNFTHQWTGPLCFPYHISSTFGGRFLDVDCLKIEPNWMRNTKEILGPMRVARAFIPGTHNSGAYGSASGFLEKYILNQDQDIWTQLVFGIRYLDFRIGYYENEGFFINHDLVRVNKLEPELKVIREFLRRSPQEVIILDFHRFPYPTKFSNDLHRKLIKILYEELGDLAIPRGIGGIKGPTFNHIWRANKNLIICYGNTEMANHYHFLWKPLTQYWGNKIDVAELKDYLFASIQKYKPIENPLWALMAELTISPVDVIFNSGSNARLADKTNKNVTKWFRDEWAGETSIVATDYFLGNDIISIAIEANDIK